MNMLPPGQYISQDPAHQVRGSPISEAAISLDMCQAAKREEELRCSIVFWSSCNGAILCFVPAEVRADLQYLLVSKGLLAPSNWWITTYREGNETI